jgi:PhnB protein
MPKTNPYLIFDGTCREAMQTYARILGAKTNAMMTFAEAPPSAGMPPGSEDRIMHACIEYDGGVLMASDSMRGMPQEKMQGMFVTLTYPDAAGARRTYAALADGGHEIMPIAKTFWSEAYGMVVDRFGTPWMVMSAQPGS